MTHNLILRIDYCHSICSEDGHNAKTEGCNGVFLIRLRESFQNFLFIKFKFSFQFPRMTILDGPNGSDKIKIDLQSLSSFKGKRNRAWLRLFFISKCLH